MNAAAPGTEPVKFCSGIGQYHSVNHPTNPKDYLSMSLTDIVAMVRNPRSMPKSEAQWAIFSTELSRVHSIQLNHGQFGAAWLDIDENPGTFQHVVDTIKALLPGVKFLSYLTKSATVDNQKCRIIFPYEGLCPGNDHVLVEKILNDLIEKAGITPDRKTQAAGQICYLPNRGEKYAFHVELGQALNWKAKFSNEISAEKDRIKADEVALDARREESQKKYAARLATGTMSPIDAFNASHNLKEYLQYCGYKKFGNRYLSPNSSSGSPGVSEKEGKWISSHESDRETVGLFGDAWDLYVFYEHDGNLKAALQAAGDRFATADGETLTKANQRAFMEQQGRNSQTHYTKKFLAGQGGEVAAAPQVIDPISLLEGFEVNENYVGKLGKEEFYYPNLIIKRHVVTVIALSGGGKTSYFYFHVAPQLADKGLKVWYLDADSPASDHKRMKELADLHGFKFLNPDCNPGTTMEGLLATLRKIADAGSDLDGWVFFIDTLKKVADLMSKKSVKEFYQLARKLANQGATVVNLGHANKFRDKEGNLVFEGVGDVRSDTDELIFFERKKNPNGGIDVTTVVDPDRNAKVRGIFKPFSFHISESREITHYKEPLAVIDGTVSAAIKATDEEILEAAKKYLFSRNEPVLQNQLVQYVADITASGSERVRRVIVQNCEPKNGLTLAGLLFVYTIGKKNAHFVELQNSVSQ